MERHGLSLGEEEEEEEEPVQETETTRSLSLSELWDMQKDFFRPSGEHIVTWLLRCWDNEVSKVLAGIELIFFTLAGIVLCLEISMEKKNLLR